MLREEIMQIYRKLYCETEGDKYHENNSEKFLWEFRGEWKFAITDIPQDSVLRIAHFFTYSVNIY